MLSNIENIYTFFGAWQLYDKGTLDDDKRARNMYKKTNRDKDGKGSIKKTKKDKDRYCAKLDNVKLVGMVEDNWCDEDEKEV